MPSAAPVPRGPSVLALGSAAELLTRPGCPVCRYAAEASDRYLAWFALEAHADPVTITRWCASLGACAMHTRRLMGQPGAAARLTAGYRYVLQAARVQLAQRRPRLARCPLCEHDDAAARRALDTLLDGLSETGVRARYLEVGGLCIPHLRAACRVRRHHRPAAWGVQALAASTTVHRPSLEALAGGPDYDADERARLRAALPPGGRLPPGICPVCLTAARAELAELVLATGTGSHRRPEGPAGDAPRQGLSLCPGHLRDDAHLGGSQVAALLAWQADCQAAVLSGLVRLSAWRGGPVRWLRGGHSSALGDECPVCLGRERAVWQELQRCRAALRAAPPRGGAQMLCVRHVLALRAADPAAGRAAAALAAERAGTLIEDLAEAFRKGTWASRHESRGPEANAWRRAAAFLDGGVFGGGPPPE
ncbi:MAG TPA: hypothetical protein VMV17_15750 [Streptosporangiaceae bacterium]|nr:hypothetical protein [Streptosporangiaceae bacterium]